MPDAREHWYEACDGNRLEQGDIFRRYPIFIPQITPEIVQRAIEEQKPSIQVDTQLFDVIVLSQSCDLANEKVDSVILCPLWSLDAFGEGLGRSDKERKKRKEEIRRGREPAFHMLASDEDLQMPLSLVEFKRVQTTPKAILEKFAAVCQKRNRLRSPYREHLSQAFARYFMRVGLPTDIPPFV